MYNLKARRLELGLTLEDVGNAVGVGRSTVRKWENGMIDNMKRDKIALLASVLKISPLQLVFDNYNDSEEINIVPVFNKLTDLRKKNVYNFAKRQLEEQNKVVPLVGSTAANPTELTYGDPIYDEVVSTDVPEKADCAIIVRGDSMEPKYKDGSIVFYKRQETIESGQIGVVEIDGDGVTLKKIILDYDNNQIILRSLNKKYYDRTLSSDEARVIGVVVN